MLAYIKKIEVKLHKEKYIIENVIETIRGNKELLKVPRLDLAPSMHCRPDGVVADSTRFGEFFSDLTLLFSLKKV